MTQRHESAYVRGIVPRVNALAAALRSSGGTVAWVVPGYSEPTAKDREFFGDEVAELYARSGGEGPPATRLAPGLDVDPTDLAVEKTGRSAWFPGSSALPTLLAARDVDRVVVCGTVTNVCVEDTVRDADHNATLHVVYRSYGDVRSTDEVLGLVAGSPVVE